MIAHEEWKNISGFSSYIVSNYGRVANKNTGYLKSQRTTKTGYKIVELKKWNKESKENIKKTAYVHRLVAEAFVPNTKGYPHINHIDEDKSNNRFDNLEWCTPEYNKYGTHIERSKNTIREKYGKRIKQLDINTGELIKTYISMTEAAEAMGVTHQAILWAISSPNHSSCGYRWEVE